MAKELASLELSNVDPEMPMVDLAYELLKQTEDPVYYRDLMKKIAEIKGFNEETMLSYMAQLYTEINIDGRFICVGPSLWGLKERHTLEQATDAAVAASVRDDDYFDDEEYSEEEEEDALEDIEDYPLEEADDDGE